MSKTNLGLAIAFKLNPEGTISAAIWRKKVASVIDRAIRREKAKAWDEGWDARSDERWIIAKNPYRVRVGR